MEHTLGPFGGSSSPPPEARGGEITTFWDSFEAWEVISPPLDSGGGGG